MRGYVTKHNGHWCAVIDSRTNGQGKRSFHRADTERAAKTLLNQLMGKVEAGTYVAPNRMTLAEFAFMWLRDYAKPNLKASTFGQYELMLRVHLIPELGEKRLTDIDPLHIQQAIAAIQRKGLKPKTVKHAYTTLRRVLNQAVDWGMLRANPIKRVEAPRVPKRELQVWTPAQVQTFLQGVAKDPNYPIYYLALSTGMRRGEILGLYQQDIDFAGGHISIQRSLTAGEKGRPTQSGPKSETGRQKVASQRRVAISPNTADVLRWHLDRHPGRDEVFLSVNGNPVHTSNLGKQFRAHIKRLGLPGITFHDLRHTHATMLLLNGVHPKVVQERLGHASVQITLDTYSHLLPHMQDEAALALDSVLGTQLAPAGAKSKLAAPHGSR